MLAPDTIINGLDTMKSLTVGRPQSPCLCTLKCMRSLTLPVAWLLLPSGMFYRAQRVSLSPNQGLNSAYNEVEYDYVPMSKKVKGRRGDPSHRGSSSSLDNNTATASESTKLRSFTEINARIEVEAQSWKPKNEVKRSPVPRVLKGADLYVVRRTKTGFGCAQPCWRW